MRKPPLDSEAEREVIGAAMLDGECAAVCGDIVSHEDFYVSRHAFVWEAIVSLLRDGDVIDTTSVRGRLDTSGNLPEVGEDYLVELTDVLPILAHAEAHARRVHELATVRAVQQQLHLALAASYSPMESVQGWLDSAESAIAVATEGRLTGAEMQPISVAVEETFAALIAQGESGSKILGNETGLADLDAKLSGLVPGELIVLAGRPSMGKSALAQACAVGIAERGMPVAMFSLEMTSVNWAQRILCADSGVALTDVRDCTLNGEDWKALTASAETVSKLPIHTYPVMSMNVLDIRRQARKVQRDHGRVGLVVVDYLQLLNTTVPGERRDLELGVMTRALKQLAGELGAPVMLLSQLNRKCEERADKRPLMADLRESGAIEQDADSVVFIYRDEVYSEQSEDRGVAEVIVRKQRNGPTGTVRLAFNGARTAFSNLARDEPRWASQ